MKMMKILYFVKMRFHFIFQFIEEEKTKTNICKLIYLKFPYSHIIIVSFYYFISFSFSFDLRKHIRTKRKKNNIHDKMKRKSI